MKAEEYMESFEFIFHHLELPIDNELRTKATIAILQEAAKDQRTNQISKEREEGNGKEEASKKQYDYLNSLGVDYEKPLTKEEASKLIDDNK